ncbi:hypothetical protein [Bacteriovorax sp. Seq25_V]|uniref:hypothetical protein n=1 Tax=Bacteriovorax sp. Seq25_V TaxID=1201288 RepID=UPI00038A4FFF|nr:hypothetical protein [Bacteriovorax sp. Seq25_V]EQC44368.1 hypothetical protein M900_A0435 [Bacteriovorax sp. Seq25_V]
MLKKNIDTIIVGRNYVSYLLGFQLLLEKRDVLLLEDERLSNGHGHFNYFSHIERSFIKSWAESISIEDTLDIDNYLEVRPYISKLGDREVLLGKNSPYSNLRELSRKFPELFSELYIHIKENLILEEEFNDSYYKLSSRLGNTLCRFKTMQNINVQTFMHHSPEVFNDLFEIFYKSLTEEGDNQDLASLFIYSSRTIVHNVLTDKLSKIEAIHLFLSLLGPRYFFNTAELNKSLEILLVSRGGFFRSSPIREWKFHKGKPWCVELNSFEGIVHPKHISFVGGRPSSFPLKFDTKGTYTNFNIKLTHDKSLTDSFDKYLFKVNKMGTQFPFLCLTNHEGNKVAQVFSRTVECQKAEFYREEIRELLKHERVIESGEEMSQTEVGQEVVCSHSFENVHIPSKVVIRDAGNALENTQLKDVHYIGPCQRSPLGLLSSLLETKDFRNFL